MNAARMLGKLKGNHPDNTYNHNNQRAALEIVKEFGYVQALNWNYLTQYGSGATMWKNDETGETRKIEPDPIYGMLSDFEQLLKDNKRDAHKVAVLEGGTSALSLYTEKAGHPAKVEATRLVLKVAKAKGKLSK